ncbi:MAG: glycosyltransferase [Proteobacteria bacterium]|nr:glycosyltransferase [Pseudomonadota bacterium]
MATLALINIDMHGHVNPTLGLTAELVRSGHRVYFYCAEEFRDAVTGLGAIFMPYPSEFGKATAETAKLQALATADGKAPPRQASVMTRFMAEFARTFGPLQKSLSTVKPDFIIYDFVSLATKIIASNLKVPTIKFFTTYASNEHYNLLSQSFAKHDYPSPEDLQLAQTLIDQQCAAVGYEGISLIQSMGLIDDQNLVFLPRALQPKGATFDSRFHFVGPCFEPVQSAAARALIPKGDGPVLIVSLGSLFHEWPEFFQSCIRAFGNTPWRVVMSIGKRLDRNLLGEIPANINIQAHIPQVALLPQADVFISHGGMNSTMESLSYGVPLVVIPQIEEQGITARQVASLGLGVHLDRSAVDAVALKTAVQQVFTNSSVQEKVATIQEQIQEAGGPKRAREVIESILAMQLTLNVSNNTTTNTY